MRGTEKPQDRRSQGSERSREGSEEPPRRAFFTFSEFGAGGARSAPPARRGGSSRWPALAAPSDLDPSFGTRGILRTGLGILLDDVARQTDGKILIAGVDPSGPIPSSSLPATRRRVPLTHLRRRRHCHYQRVDMDFGEDLAIQPDGKIVVVGAVGFDSRIVGNWGVLRYNTNGTLDTTFGSSGVVQTDFGGAQTSPDYALAVALQADGSIVVAGHNGGAVLCTLARYTPSGFLDAAFDGDGKLIAATVGGATCSDFTDVGVQQEDKIVASGFGANGFALACYNPGGTPDTGFGSGRGVSTPGTSKSQAQIIEPSGRIVLAGSWMDGPVLTAYKGDPPPTPTATRVLRRGYSPHLPCRHW